MRWSRGVWRIKDLIVVLLLTLGAHNLRAQEIELWGYGPALENENVRKALMQAVDWPSLTASIFDDPHIPVVLYPQEGEALDNVGLEFDPELATGLLKEVVYGEEGVAEEGVAEEILQLTLLYVSDFKLALLAGAVIDNLEQLNINDFGHLIEVTPLEASSEDELYEAEVYLATEGADLNALVLELAK